jgi:pimeloyl-ACP methyl ester carboxylesterase
MKVIGIALFTANGKAMKVAKYVGIILFAGCFFGQAGVAGDVKREADFADDITRMLTMGEAIRLEARGRQFLSLYTDTERADDKGAALILHDIGGHPDQKPLVNALRTVLPAHHWATLALQMPLRERGAAMSEYDGLFPEARDRIQAGIDYLKGRGAESIVVVGYGLGGLMAAYALSEGAADIEALVTISLPVPETGMKTAQTLEFIRKIKKPMLDIYGALDVPEVTKSARERRLAAKANSGYRQVRIEDEGHRYPHDEGLVVKRVYSWLSGISGRTPAGRK